MAAGHRKSWAPGGVLGSAGILEKARWQDSISCCTQSTVLSASPSPWTPYWGKDDKHMLRDQESEVGEGDGQMMLQLYLLRVAASFEGWQGSTRD